MFFVCLFAIVMLAIGVAVFNFNLNAQNGGLSNMALANIEALANDENGSGDCKWKVIDCPGLGTGDYEACLVNGDGYSCTCGTVTRDCPK